MVWTFGDGQQQTVKTGITAPVTHSYSTSGTYNVCATVYAYCGTATICKNVTATGAGAVGSLSALGNIKVYPNPAKEVLTVEGISEGTYAISNAIGQRLMHGSLSSQKASIDVSALPAGTYLLQLTDAKGNRGAISFVRQ